MTRVVLRGVPYCVVGLILGATDWPIWLLAVVGLSFALAMALHDAEVEREKGEYDAELVEQAWQRIDAAFKKGVPRG